jgi:hypothetical protein
LLELADNDGTFGAVDLAPVSPTGCVAKSCWLTTMCSI